MPPDDFIPVAEETGLIVPIGEWVLREACREAASWPRPLNIAVNLSPVQFRERATCRRSCTRILLDTGLAPHRLELEITEGVLINDIRRATRDAAPAARRSASASRWTISAPAIRR